MAQLVYVEVADYDAIPQGRDGKLAKIYDNGIFLVTTEENSKEYPDFQWASADRATIQEYFAWAPETVKEILSW